MVDKIKDLEQEIGDLRLRLAKKENQLRLMKHRNMYGWPLSDDEIARYSRQIILPEFGGVQAQVKLKNTSFLIVGAGGLGCPAAQYLVAAGAGTVGIVDYDEVETTNLHRQILHVDKFVGQPKVLSAECALRAMNPNVKIMAFHRQMNSDNTLEMIGAFDIILDCSDNMATRYLLNDACVIKGKPLVSGSALQYDGQLTVYNYNNGPCYRCLFPVPQPPETVTNCGDGGVLGPVTGVIGSLQAQEAIKIALDIGEVLTERLLLYDGTATAFRTIRLRPRRKDCDVCSDHPVITRLINYEQFCGMRASDKDFAINILHENHRMSVQEYVKTIFDKEHLLIDVRSPVEFEMCNIFNAINIPLKSLLDDSRLEEIKELAKPKVPVVLVCRRGNDSQIAVQHLRNKLQSCEIKDIRGGLYAWHFNVDPHFPIY